MPKYLVLMENDHELTIDAPSWGDAVETALRHMPGVAARGWKFAPNQELSEVATDATDNEESE